MTHPYIKNVEFTPTGKTAQELDAIKARRDAAPVLTGWEVKRSGPGLTVSGFDDRIGRERSVTGIGRIKPSGADGRVHAIGKDGKVAATLLL